MTQPGSTRKGSTALGILLGVITGVMILGLVWSLTVANRPNAAKPAASPTASADTVASPEATPTNSPSPTPSVEPSPTPSAITSLSPDNYLTVLESLGKQDWTLEQATKKAEELSVKGLRVEVLDTDAFKKLTPGYWALVVPDAASSQEAKDRCPKFDRPFGDNCYVRHIEG